MAHIDGFFLVALQKIIEEYNKKGELDARLRLPKPPGPKPVPKK